MLPNNPLCGLRSPLRLRHRPLSADGPLSTSSPTAAPASSTPESCWRIRILGSSERSDPMRITTKTGYFNWVSPEQCLLRAQLKVIQRRLFLGLSVLGLYVMISILILFIMLLNLKIDLKWMKNLKMVLLRQLVIFLYVREGKFADHLGLIWLLGFGICVANRAINYSIVRFGGDCLYICDRPGCDHIEEERDYMLFRGIFKNFKKSRVWRTINDGNRSKIDLNCAFCSCKQTWDLHSAFCLRRDSGFHEDGEPVVRADVCENGHVSGAWTDWWPL